MRRHTTEDIGKARAAHVGIACALALLLLLFNVAQASAARGALEEVKKFGDENVQFVEATSVAINETGAGGVPAGTTYIVAGKSASVASYSAQGDFREAWGWSVAEPGVKEFQRCGPDGEAAHPTCPPLDDGSHVSSSSGWGVAGEGIGQIARPNGIAVDQTTGNVYVFNKGRQKGVVQVFSADGSAQLGSFGEFGKRANFPEPAESIEEGPAKFHGGSVYGNSLTVNSQGVVYIGDEDLAEANSPHHQRIMSFEPASPGDYEHYVYAGRSKDIEKALAHPNEDGFLSGPIAGDSAGDLFLSTGSVIYELAPPSPTPLCEYDPQTGGIEGMTVDPETGEVYLFSFKKHRVERLVCQGGQFVAVENIALSPKPTQLMAIGFDSTQSFAELSPGEPGPPGILYAVSSEDSLPGPRTVGTAHIFAPAVVTAPSIESQGVSEVGKNTATVHATINPAGAATRYAFQYIAEAQYQSNPVGSRFAGAAEAPLGGGGLSTGLAGVPVVGGLTGLSPNTRYHFRVVAENCPAAVEEACTAFGADETFRTFPSGAGLSPDHRAYELVSPAQKAGGQVWPAFAFAFTPSCLECKPGLTGRRLPEFSSVDGDRIVYQGSPFANEGDALNRDSYLAVRTGSGWQTSTLTPPLGESGEGDGVVGVDQGLSRALLKQGRQSLAGPSGVPNFYGFDFSSPGTLTPALTEVPPHTGERVALEYGGGSPDLSRVFFSANDALTGATPVAPAAEYEVNRTNVYEYAEGQVRLVNVLPGNAQTLPGATLGAAESGTERPDFSHAISADGSRVFWSSATGQVYVRENASVTREIPDHVGRYVTASTDGAKVLLSDGKLLEVGGGETEIDLTAGQGGFVGLAGQSEDLSRIYFVDTAVLTNSPNSQGAEAVNGKDNLYAWNQGQLAFVASLAAGDSFDWTQSAATRTAQASPSGEWMSFVSFEPLTGLSKKGPCVYEETAPPSFPQAKCAEVFMYGAASGTLSCPSCSPTEESPLGNSQLTTLPNAAAANPQQRYITDQGRLFFDSPNRLSPDDSNSGAEDVYEFEPAGVGTCAEAPGCVSLVSPGNQFTDANLLAIDPEGRNVFFTTRQQLTRRDQDGLFDLYDAREDGGIAAEEEVEAAPCRGEACQAVVAPPVTSVPGSSTVEGAAQAKPSKKPKPKHKKKSHHKKRRHHRSKRSKAPKGGKKKPGSKGHKGGSK
jgi:hypothetical protein